MVLTPFASGQMRRLGGLCPSEKSVGALGPSSKELCLGCKSRHSVRRGGGKGDYRVLHCLGITAH